MAETDLIKALNHQLAKYEAAVAEFTAIDAQLQAQERTARVADMIRINRETINAMERGASLIRERLKSAREARGVKDAVVGSTA